MATAKDIVNKMLETSDPDDPTQYLKGYRQQWYSLMRGGAHVDTFKTIEAALQRAKATRLCRGKEPVYIEQHELPDAPEGVFVSTEPTGIVYDVTKDYRAVQRGVTEAVDPDAPEPYLDWLGQKVDLGPLEKIRFGAHIHLSDEDMIRQNASESGIDVDSQAFWDEVERCMAIMESHCLQLLRESGLHVSDEGHDETGARVASVWIDTPDYERAVALVKAVINWAEGDWPSTTSGTMDYAFGADTQQRIYAMTEDAARFIDVTIEFTGTDALVEWSRLNLNEAITGDPDDPEVFLRSYVPRMLGRVFIDFDVIKPHFPDAPRNWVRENVNGVDLFRYNRVGEMREVLRQMKADHRQRGPNVPVDVIRYRYRLNNPQGSSIVRGWLDKIGCPVPVIQWVCETNAPIWFFVSAKEFNDYMRMVYPQVKLESLDDPPADLVNKLTPKVVCPNCGANAEIGYGPEKLDTHPTAPVHYDDDVELARYLAPGDEFDPNVSIHHFDVKHIYKCRQCNQRFDGTQPKLTVESVDDPDDPVEFLKRFKPAWKLLSHIKNGHFYFIDDAGRVAVADYSMRNQRDPGSADDGLLVLDKTKPLTRYRGIQGRKMWHIPVTQYYGGIGDKPIPSATGASEEEFADLWPKLEPLGFTQQIREEDEDIDPKAYLDATTGWIDTFLNAGMTPSAEDTHRGQFWKRYECHGFNYLVVVSSRVPRFMIVERNDALYGTNTFRRVFEYPDGDINGLVTEFTALDRLLTKAITSAFDGFPAFDEKVDQLYKQHKRRRQRWLSGKIKEGVDDPDLQHYLPHISPERCLHCNNDLTQASQVERNYYNRDSRIALILPGHYEAADSAFEPDMRLEPAVLERLTNCPTFEDKCANCGTDTSQPVRHEESLDDPSPTYLEGIHELADVAVKLDELGFAIHKASHWGRWIVLSGHLFQPYSYNPLPPDQRITPEEYRARVERVMAEFQITQFHLTLGTDSFKLAVPKVQFIDGETLDTVKDWVTKHPSKNQSDWLPETADPDDPSVNVNRHIETMDIDAMMERLGFYKRLPSWKCADPNYCWYERTMRLKLETVPVANVPNPLLEAKLLERNGKLNEMGGAVNIWLSPKGQAILCHDHAEHAASEILKKPLKSWPGTYWEARGRVYQEMFRRGWMRIAIPHAQKKLMVDYRGKTTEAQWEWIYEKAGQDKLAITDDQENVIVDYREGAEDAVQEAAQTWANVYRLPGGFRMVRDDNTAQLQTRSGQQIGFMAWRGASPRVGVTDRTIEIEHLEVNERYQNRGLGEAMLRQLKALIPTLYPHARYVVAKTATSKGIIRLLRRVFGPELRTKGTEKLPKRSPADWISTMNRGYVLFKLTEAMDVDDPSAFLQHMETDWRKILRKHGWKPHPHSDHLSYTLEFPDRVWGANWPLRIYAGHGWNPEPEFVYDHPDPDDPDLDAEDAAYEQWLADHPEGRRDVNFPDYIYFQFGREYYRRIEVPTNKLDVFCSRLLRAIKPILGTEHIDHDHPETSDLTTMVWNKGREIARELQIPLKESVDDPDDPEAFIRHTPVEVRAWAVGYHGHHQTQVDFNAEPYFAELAQKPDGLETMIAMAKEGFTMSHQVDDVGRWFSDTILKDLYAQSEMGVEVSITERDVKRWVEFNKPDWYPYLWPNDIKVQESKETLPKAKAMTGVREVHESIDLPPEDEPENVLPSAEKSLVTAELKRLDFGPKPERGVEWIYGEEMPRFWYNTYKGADGSNRAIYIYFVGGQTPEVQTRNYNAPAKAWFQRGKDAPPTAPAQSQAHLAAIIRDLDSAMQKSAADSLPVEQEFEAIERVIRHHRQWWEDTLDYLINTQGGTIPGRMGPGQPA